ncbi:MAG TPA: hypothetical protein VGD55_02065 [Acidothermaceae bacterium]
MPWQFGHRRRRPFVSSLDLHPNLAEILGILNQIPRLTGKDVARLAHGWRDNAYLSIARADALGPDTPLVLEALAAFERVEAVFQEELFGWTLTESFSEEGSATTVRMPAVVNNALRAVRDALAAAYARPVLARSQYIALINPWHQAFSAD